MLHPSKIFGGLLLVFLVATAFFTFYPLPLSYGIYLIFFSTVILFFFKLRIVRYIALFFIFILLAGYGVDRAKTIETIGGDTVRGIVIETPIVSGRSQQLTVMPEGSKMKINVTTSQFPEYEFGENIEILGEFNDVRKSEYFVDNPGYFLSRGIRYTVYFPKIERVDDVKIDVLSKYFIPFRRYMINIRKGYEEKIARVLPEPEAGLLSGILLGSRADLSDQTKELLARVGIIHIIALSGYNITIVAEGLKKLFKNFSGSSAFYFSFLGIWSFVCATGFSASVVRAAIMGSLLLFSKKLGRQSNAAIAVLFASCLMVFFSPHILVYDVGFQLSFAAVCGIIFLSPLIERYFYFLGKIFGPVLAATLSAQLFTIPIVSYYFGRISVISLVANILILPFIPFLMLAGFLTASSGFISIWLAEKLAIITWFILSYFFAVAEKLGTLPYAEASYKMPFSVLVIFYILLFELIFILAKVKKNEEKTS